LEEKKAAEQKAAEYKASYGKNKAAADALRGKLAEMKSQIVELKSKREALVARVHAAKAQKSINRTVSGFGASSAISGLKRMEEKAMQLEAEAEASGELYAKEVSLDEEMAKLGRDQQVEEELAALLKKYEG
jgi:phage shock protein A